MTDDSLLEQFARMKPWIAKAMYDDRTHIQELLHEKYGINKIHIAYLMELKDGPLSLRELSDRLMFDAANTTRAIHSLNELGYVADDRASDKARKYKVFLTDDGKRVADEVGHILRERGKMMLEGVDDADMEALIRVMRKVCSNLEIQGSDGRSDD